MRRFWRPLLLLALALGGCRIEPTPAEYIDLIEVPEDDLAATQGELRDRLRSTASALQRRDLADLLTALTPVENVIGFGPSVGDPITDPTTLGFRLSEMTAGREVQMTELTIEVGPRNDVAWFRTAYAVDSETEEPYDVRFSGVFLRQGGDWRLVQAHVSTPLNPELPLPEEAAADTPAAGG